MREQRYLELEIKCDLLIQEGRDKTALINRLAARVEELEAALGMLWIHYLLPITDQQKAQVRAALAADKETT